MASARPQLRALAERLGVESAYVSALDGRPVPTSDATREALVHAMGFDAGNEAASARALRSLKEPTVGAAASAATCLSYRERLGERRVFGLWTNLYAVRSDEGFGFGDLGDLRALVRAAAARGAAFVGLNPLHALGNRGGDVCPYAPVTRLFRNPLYLRAADVPELERADEARGRLAALAPRLRALREAPRLDAAAVEEALFAVLRPLHRFFRAEASAERRRAYDAYRERQGGALLAFATFQAAADALEPEAGCRDWRRWPRELQVHGSPAVRALAARREEDVDFHAWLQFELDRQLAAVADEARAGGMAIGLYTDLALGSAPGGFDTWARPELFAAGVSVGAPPDAFSREGQDWGFPPLAPGALALDGFAFWRSLLEANLHGAGALRVDHALGLRRLFWIPEGASPREGAYVRYPEADLVAGLAEVSRRVGALVIGEDLGTVPDGFSQEIQARGLLSSRVLLFEQDGDGRFRPGASWPEACLATANTHDLPPLAGWLRDDDLALRRAVGQIPDDVTRDEMERERHRDRAGLRARLVEEGCLDEVAGYEPEAWSVAVTRFLCGTPAVMVGLSLDDLAGERIPINLPGVSPERHPSWVRRMRVPLGALFEEPAAGRALDAVPATRRASGRLPR